MEVTGEGKRQEFKVPSMRRPQQPHILFGVVTRAGAETLAVVPFVVGKTRGSFGPIGHYTE